MILIESEIATLDDLYLVDGKAELIDGRIVKMMSTGFLPSRLSLRLAHLLGEYERSTNSGLVLGDNVGYAVPALKSGRQSFSPDVSYFTGKLPENLMRFVDGAPVFAVEIRSECDYRPGADAEMAGKRADYFEAGTQVVWDVDTLGKCIHCYRASAPLVRETFNLNSTAHAEPALPGLRIKVDQVFLKSN